ncbi:MAG: hypothetical protein OEQ39_23360 [Gammaproteobacteria bacterium]|nr:hypothetical protein [Gammaproteobacteria bacterium]MDH3379872.1 hypothetical protein [Gammaproteobacteria bacterium]
MSSIKSFKSNKGNGRVRKAAIIAAKNKQAELESKRQLPEEFSAKDFDFVRARTLSSQI